MIKRQGKNRIIWRLGKMAAAGIGVLTALALAGKAAAQTADPLLNALIKKGILSEDEAKTIKAEADASQTNNIPPEASWNKWTIHNPIKNVELFGDIRLRYEGRHADGPGPDAARVELERSRYALRLGLRGEALDDFYYGIRLETASNPRSPWVTFGQTTSGTGPFSKSAGTINLGQIYLGWRPEEWVDITVGKMPNPLYTTSMVWDPDINPEGAAEHLKYKVGEADLFVNFSQFLYEDLNPSYASGGLGFNNLVGQTTDEIFQIGWQAGMNYHITTNTSAKIAGTLYQYIGLKPSTLASGSSTAPYFGDNFVGEGAYAGAQSFAPINGASGSGPVVVIPGYQSTGFANNQVGLNHLLVVDVPFEINFKISKLQAKIFGDGAYNLEGKQRAQDAATGYAAYLASGPTPAGITPFKAQTQEVKAYQIGFALSNDRDIGLLNGSVLRRHAWEVRAFWQHIEQYALDPNLLDSDFFEGRGNLQGFFTAAAYAFSDNMMATVRYGHANRINDAIGTGGSNQDIPSINPVQEYDIFQADLTFKF
jgi:hypothetical protein